MSLTRKQQYGFDFERKNIQSTAGLGKSKYDSMVDLFPNEGDSIEARLVEKTGEDGLTAARASAIARRIMILKPEYKMHSFRTRDGKIVIRRRLKDEIPSTDEEDEVPDEDIQEDVQESMDQPADEIKS